MWDTCTVDYYSAIKWKEFLPLTTRRMELKGEMKGVGERPVRYVLTRGISKTRRVAVVKGQIEMSSQKMGKLQGSKGQHCD